MDDVGVVQEPVEQADGGGVLGQEPAPLVEGPVGGDAQGAAFVHDLDADSLANVDGDSNYVRVQVLTNSGALDREKQLAVVRQLTDIVAAAAGDPTLADRTWVLLTEAPDGGWGLSGHANTNEELVSAARAQIAELRKNSPVP
jgi:phenylpyruvate tautomerase PptA (4-oxalocrotonate tautomerase family)